MNSNELILSKYGVNTMSIKSAEQTYECIVCNRTCLSPIQLTVHYVVAHQLIACETCLLLFSEHDDLVKHDTQIHTENVINCCDNIVSTNIQSICKHQMKMCEMCDTMFDEWNNHYQMVHKLNQIDNPMKLTFDQDSFMCSICTHLFKIQQFFIHYLSVHKFSIRFILKNIQQNENAINLLRKFDDIAIEYANCNECGEKYDKNVPKIFHRLLCEEYRICKKCYLIFANGNLLADHSKCCKIDDFIKFCKYCDYNEGEADSIEDHHRVFHEFSSSTIDDLFTINKNDRNCKFCEFNNDHINALIIHYLKCHKMREISLFLHINNLKDTKLKRFRTESQVFKETESIETFEMLTDFDTNSMKIVYSSATDYDSSDTESIDNSTTKDTIIKCFYCRHRASDRSTMAEHLHASHDFVAKRKEMRCSVCKKNFSNSTNLFRHFKTVHHKINAKKYQCPFCSYSSKGKWNMR